MIADFVSLYFDYKHYIGEEDLPQWLRELFQRWIYRDLHLNWQTCQLEEMETSIRVLR